MSWLIRLQEAALEKASAGGGPPASGDSILQETGDYLLLESGDKILLE